ncbi:unnamed protein product [Caenorhabditis angaria]|uniref:Uncharacterized protein n=1 Tax=Caenorhabditis angaria TaxID=860376 RepID=A0A9P1IGT5_9PELO|nr:unnamed protein product [Caenorhabditis angaria]
MFGYLTLFACIAVSFAAEIQQEVKNAVNEVTSTKDGDVWCPILMGTHCGKSSVFHYWSCCGTLKNECCFNLQTWVWVVIAVFAVITVASVILSFIRCICCRRN